jgi:hypothetical protein
MFSIFNYFKKAETSAIGFYLEQLKKEFKSTFNHKRNFFQLIHKMDISSGVVCPKNIFFQLFENCEKAKLDFKVKKLEPEDVYLISKEKFSKIFNGFNPDCLKRNFSFVLILPIYVIYVDDKIKFIFNYDTFTRNGEKYFHYSDKALEKFFNLKKKK